MIPMVESVIGVTCKIFVIIILMSTWSLLLACAGKLVYLLVFVHVTTTRHVSQILSLLCIQLMSCKMGCWVISPTKKFQKPTNFRIFQELPQKKRNRFYQVLRWKSSSWLEFNGFGSDFHGFLGKFSLAKLCPGYTAGEGKSGRYSLLRLVVNIPVFYREFDIFQVFLGMPEASKSSFNSRFCFHLVNIWPFLT